LKYAVVLHRQAIKDLEKIKCAGLAGKVRAILQNMQNDPFVLPPAYEKLKGELSGSYSRRINIQHRLVYSIDEENREIRVASMWSHYE